MEIHISRSIELRNILYILLRYRVNWVFFDTNNIVVDFVIVDGKKCPENN